MQLSYLILQAMPKITRALVAIGVFVVFALSIVHLRYCKLKLIRHSFHNPTIYWSYTWAVPLLLCWSPACIFCQKYFMQQLPDLRGEIQFMNIWIREESLINVSHCAIYNPSHIYKMPFFLISILACFLTTKIQVSSFLMACLKEKI